MTSIVTGERTQLSLEQLRESFASHLYTTVELSATRSIDPASVHSGNPYKIYTFVNPQGTIRWKDLATGEYVEQDITVGPDTKTAFYKNLKHVSQVAPIGFGSASSPCKDAALDTVTRWWNNALRETLQPSPDVVEATRDLTIDDPWQLEIKTGDIKIRQGSIEGEVVDSLGPVSLEWTIHFDESAWSKSTATDKGDWALVDEDQAQP